MIEFSSKSAKETIALGEKLAKNIDGGTDVACYGGSGMGKTTIICGISLGMGLTCNVSSPTFAIVNVYGEHNELCHFDMYRVESWDDLYSTGFFDYIDMGSVLCVEWSENVENALPENNVRVYMEKGDLDNARIIRIDGVKDENSLC